MKRTVQCLHREHNTRHALWSLHKRGELRREACWLSMAIKLSSSVKDCETQPPNEWPDSPRANGSHSEEPFSRAPSPPLALHLLRSLKRKSQDFRSSHNSKRFFETLAKVLAYLLHTAPKPETRTMSAILLCRHLTHHHDSFLLPLLSPAARSSLHFVLLSSLQQEPIKSIPKKLYDTISELAATILPDDPSAWSNLLPLLFQWVTSPEPRL
ncbi:uncharacterized protein HKW66_Vig0006550 [Vigna angularis]|uniref:Uncharacterized protein n=1 Tax=Phaseolus angularis TaxID=3914 RepID=A0A8T0LB26_PHAAN|nr:uncharacterized protein HKW66_Vig0006550 [Vigna angularis]